MKTKPSQKKHRLPPTERATLTEEFAAQFGRQKIWTYRQLYAGRIKAITGFGNLMIPRSELDRILESAVFDAIGKMKQQAGAKP